MAIFSKKDKPGKEDLQKIQEKRDLQSLILTNISIVGLSLEQAIKDANVDPEVVKRWMEEDAEFRRRIEEAKKVTYD
ncbi:MAG: hypothetical protein JXB60_03400 [Candidatus Cloacimonetes bacterium]|nr:hypothetical protein [Candidatus Cloacimonadota bacterium]